MELGIEEGARLATEDELHDGATFPQSFVGQLKVGLDRCQQDGTNDEGNEQACDTLANIAPSRASPQREPTGRPGHQEEKGHPPEIEKADKKVNQNVRVRILDVPIKQVIKGMNRVEQEHAQDRQHLQPIQIMQSLGLTAGAFCRVINLYRICGCHLSPSTDVREYSRQLVVS